MGRPKNSDTMIRTFSHPITGENFRLETCHDCRGECGTRVVWAGGCWYNVTGVAPWATYVEAINQRQAKPKSTSAPPEENNAENSEE